MPNTSNLFVLKGHPGCGKRHAVLTVCSRLEDRVELTCMDAVDTWAEALKFMTDGTAAGGNKLALQLWKPAAGAGSGGGSRRVPPLRLWFFHDLQCEDTRKKGPSGASGGSGGASAVAALVRAATAQPCALPGLVVVAVHDFTPQTMVLRTCGAIETACFGTKEYDHRQQKIQRVMALAPVKVRVRAHGRPWLPRVVKVAAGGDGEGGAGALQRLCVQVAAGALAPSPPVDALQTPEPLLPPPGRAPSDDGVWHTIYVLDCIPASGTLQLQVLLRDAAPDDCCVTWVRQTTLQLQTGFTSLRRTKGRDDGRSAVLVQSAWTPPHAVFKFTALLEDGETFGDYLLEVYRLLLQARHTGVRLALTSLQGALRACRTAAQTADTLQGFAKGLRTRTILATRDVDALAAAVTDLKSCTALLDAVQCGRPPPQLTMTMSLCDPAADHFGAVCEGATVEGLASSVAVPPVPNDVYVAARTPFAAVTWLLRTAPRSFGTDLRSVALVRDTYGAAMMLDMFWGAWVAQLTASAASAASVASAVLGARSQSEHDHAAGAGVGSGSNSLCNIPVSMLAVLAVLHGRHVLAASSTKPSKTSASAAYVPVLTGPTANSRRAARQELQALVEADLFAQNTRLLKACVSVPVPLPAPVVRFSVEWVGL